MSKVIRSAIAGQPSDLLRADHAGGWSGQHGAHRQPRGLRRSRSRRRWTASDAASRARPRSREPFAEPRDVALHDRAEIGVHHRRRHSLEFAELGRDLVRDAGEGLGEFLAPGCARAISSCAGADEAVEEADRDRLAPGVTQRGARPRGTPPRPAASRPCRRGAPAPAPPGAGRATPASGGLSTCRSYRSGRFCRPISSRSRNPSVVISPVFTPRCWISALVATVVPWPK